MTGNEAISWCVLFLFVVLLPAFIYAKVIDYSSQPDEGGIGFAQAMELLYGPVTIGGWAIFLFFLLVYWNGTSNLWGLLGSALGRTLPPVIHATLISFCAIFFTSTKKLPSTVHTAGLSALVTGLWFITSRYTFEEMLGFVGRLLHK